MTSVVGFRKFFFRLWLWHLLLTFIFAVILVLCFLRYTDFTASKAYAWANFIAFIAGSVHTLILLIVSVNLLVRSQWKNGGIFTLHFFVSSAIVYWLYVILVGAFITKLFH